MCVRVSICAFKNNNKVDSGEMLCVSLCLDDIVPHRTLDGIGIWCRITYLRPLFVYVSNYTANQPFCIHPLFLFSFFFFFFPFFILTAAMQRRSEEDERKAAKKSERGSKAVKNFSLISFGDEEEADEAEVAAVKQKAAAATEAAAAKEKAAIKIKSSHDVLNDEKLGMCF